MGIISGIIQFILIEPMRESRKFTEGFESLPENSGSSSVVPQGHYLLSHKGTTLFEVARSGVPYAEEDPAVLLETVKTLLAEGTNNSAGFNGVDQEWREFREKSEITYPVYVDPVRQYLSEIGDTPLLTHEQEISLGRRIQAGIAAASILEKDDLSKELHDEYEALAADGLAAREHMIRANLRLVVSVAKKYSKGIENRLDRIQDGNIGLMRAVERYDPEKGFRFSTYATWWIRQAVTRANVETGRTIRLPVHMHDGLKKAWDLSREFVQENGREPGQSELLRLLMEGGLTASKAESILLVLQQQMAYNPASLDKSIGDESITLGDIIPSNDREVADQALDMVYGLGFKNDAQEILTPKEYDILVMRLGLDGSAPMTLEAVGEKYGVSRERIRQIEFKARVKLRKKLGNKYQVGDNGESNVSRRKPEKQKLPTNGVVYKEHNPVPDVAIRSTLYERAAALLSDQALTVSPKEMAMLRIIAGADRDSFRQVCKEIADGFDIPAESVVSQLLDIVIRAEDAGEQRMVVKLLNC